MESYIDVKRIQEEVEFINLAITTKNVDAKNKEDLINTFSKEEFNLENLSSNIQIHSDVVNVINSSNIGVKEEADALVTNLKQAPLLVFTADCVPIAIIDKKNKAIGNVHAGWRGTYAQIAKNTIDTMKKEYNTNVEDLVCVIGPSIGPCCYEVSKELVEKFNTILTNYDEKFYIIKEGKYYLDLWKINEYILKECGVKESNIINLNICTSCNCDKFHSYRIHEKTQKRIGMLIQIK
ncbi:MAG: peptidoglycan editing factor PgeF [Peptostreptococcaceae bacterium]